MSYPESQLRERARRVRLLCVDVDGVLTDAGMYYGPDGEVLKKFNTRDGMGMARVRAAGVAVAIISGEDSAIVHARAAKLQIDDVFCGASDKLAAVVELCSRHGLQHSEVAFVGDDLNDLSALAQVGLACAVSDAAEPVQQVAHYVTRRRGGDGAVREVCELLIAAQGDGD
ncbi:MAG: HAD-IIIA family hydrolase [Chloroflexi bacterium]|nr:HAD-IIIA family hydrolase [Chloroflexota bacterium]